MITGWLMRTLSPLWGEGEDASRHSITVLPEGREDKPGHEETVGTE
jgi:hypothetical protein